MVDIYDGGNWEQWVDKLSEENYLVVDGFISEEELHIFRSYMEELLRADAFSKAGIGAQAQYQVESEIRGDYIKWLDRAEDDSLTSFFERVDYMIQQLNRYCFLSLSGAEFHYAYYPKGTFYKRHLDQFQHKGNRLISVIIYLNTDWVPGNGGELKVYLANKEETIAPVARRVVFLRSSLVEHEVLPTLADRYSITGWLLHQSL